MARYFFHTADGSRERDALGTELADRAAAQRNAIRFAGDVLSDEPSLLRDDHEFKIEVTNERQELLFTIVTRVVEGPASNGV